MKIGLHKIFLGTALWVAYSVATQAGPALLGNKGLQGQTLDADAVKAVLLGKRATLGNTRVIIIVAKNSPTQEAYFKDRIGMTTDQFQTYWRRLFMTGGGSAPKVVDTEAEACKLAAETQGGVAVGDSEKPEGLAVLSAK